MCRLSILTFATALTLTLPGRAWADPPAGMVVIPAGEFMMGDTFSEGDDDELPVHAVYVDVFLMDTYEVTNQQYCDALNWAYAQGNLITVTYGVVYKYGGTSYPYCSTTSAPEGHPHYGEQSRITWNGSAFGVVAGKANHPMVLVSWYGSVAYCNWRSAMDGKPLCYDLSTWTCNFGSGYRLPTEAEWEKAARGGTPGHRFPWSDTNTIEHARANYYSSSDYSYDTSPTRGYHPCWGVGDTPYTSPVGFFTGALQYKTDWGWPGTATSYQTTNSVNGYGLYDMAGNVWEWCNDRHSDTYYSGSPYNNPTGPVIGSANVVRDGGWFNNNVDCRAASRYGRTPASLNRYGGLRCASSVRETETQKLVAPDPAGADQFGHSVAISGDTAVVGSMAKHIGGNPDVGAAYIYVRSGSIWTYQATLTASDGGANDLFGYAVAIDGDTMVVGAPYHTHATYSNAGSAYVFVRSGGVWTQQQKLTGSGPDLAGDFFGRSVSVSGDTAVIGAYGCAQGVGGLAYVFVRSGGVWTEQQKLVAGDAAMDDIIGWSVSVNGDTAVIGAPGDDYAGKTDAGSAYVFVRSGVVWTQQQKLTASDAAGGDYLGFSVSISSDTAVIGANGDDHAGGTDAGSAYVFVRSAGIWTQQAKLTASDAAEADRLGNSVVVDGSMIVVGARENDLPGQTDAGAAYLFVLSGEAWTQQAIWTASDAANGDYFSRSCALQGNTGLIGADMADLPGKPNAGAAYVFHASQPADINCEDLSGFDFGGVRVGTYGTEHTWAITNEGVDTLTGNITLEGANPTEFCFTQGDGAFELEPEENRVVGVRFCPGSIGFMNAILRIISNDLGENPCDLPLSGTGTGPDINCEALADYDWGEILGGCSDVHYWNVTNEGGATLTVDSMAFIGPDANIFEFHEGGAAPYTLGPGQSHTVGIRFCCDSGGLKQATLHITSDDPVTPECDKALSGTCQSFLVGGAVYSDLENPIGSGVTDVTIHVDGSGGNYATTTSGMMGLWQIADVPAGTYTVTATKSGCLFQHVVGGVPGVAPPVEITVDAYHQAANQSIQFLATCTPLVPDLKCEDLAGFDFAGVDVGDCSPEHTWMVTNTGTATLTGSIWLTGSDPQHFTFVQGSGDFILEPAQSRDVTVRFCPLSVGDKTAILRIASNDPDPDENPCDLPLSGTGIGVPNINCEDLSGYDFGSIVVPLCSAERVWAVTNEGTMTLSGTISLTGADPGEFEFTRGGGAYELPPGESRTVGVQFCPDTGGIKSAVLRIESNDADENPCDLALTGQGLLPGEPEINCEDLAGFDFGSKTIGYCTVEHTWTLINEGTANLTGMVLLSGADAAHFEFVRGGGGFGLGPGAQRIIGVRFCPVTVGAKSATLEIQSNDADEDPCLLPLSGIGGACAASRNLAVLWADYCDDEVKPVAIDIDAPAGTYVVALEDEPPAGWTATNISHGGQWDADNHRVKWGPFFDYTPIPTQVSFDAVPPSGTQGSHCFTGVISLNGINYEVCGDECSAGPSGAYIPADQPQPPCPGCADCSCSTCEDRRVVICEMAGYACAWRTGCNDDLAGMARSALVWVSGECYCWGWDEDTQQLFWFPTSCPPPASGCCSGRGGGDGPRGGGSAERALPESVQGGAWFTVTIAVASPPGTIVLALEDQPPAGWQVGTISNGGVWDGVHGKVKWGPFFAPSLPEQVTYELLPPAGASGEYCFSGTVSFDGFSRTIDGALCVPAQGVPGDLNCDGLLDFADVEPFVLALLDADAYAAAYPGCARSAADLNCDSTVNGLDIGAFVQCLTAGGCAPCP